MSKYSLEIISPVHIGSGYRYSCSEFLIKDRQLIRVKIDKIFEALKGRQKEDFILSLEEPGFKLGEFLKNIDISIPNAAILYAATVPPSIIPAEIVECVKTNYAPFIPGSSIKGVIRTALLYHMIGEYEARELRRILNYPNPKKIKGEADNMFHKLLAGTTKNPSSSDLLRFLQISDSNCVNQLEVMCEQILEGGYNGWSWYQKGGRAVQTYVEALPAGLKVEGGIEINYSDKLFKELGLGEKEGILEFNRIMEIIYTFSKDLVNHELNFARKYNIEFLLAFYEKMQKLNSKHEPLLRLGHGSGFIATTIGLKLKNDPNLFEKVRRLTRGRSYRYEFPKSRKIDYNRKVPPGWCRLLIK
jgi:CRISPR type III-A-associated RAMP protein Csm5